MCLCGRTSFIKYDTPVKEKLCMAFQIFLFLLSSPRSGTSSNASTPSTKKLDGEKPTTPISKSVTPTSGGSGSSTAAGASGLKPVVCDVFEY